MEGLLLHPEFRHPKIHHEGRHRALVDAGHLAGIQVQQDIQRHQLGSKTGQFLQDLSQERADHGGDELKTSAGHH